MAKKVTATAKNITIDMEELDQLRLKNILYKIQLEQEKAESLRIQAANMDLCARLSQQELKLWENVYKIKISENKYNILEMDVDADSGQVNMSVLPKNNVDDGTQKQGV